MKVPPPPDPAKLDPRVERWSRGDVLWRVHPLVRAPNEFNATPSSSRFRPFTSRGRIVPTLYAGGTVTASIGETVFHDLPPETPDQVVPHTALVGLARSAISPTRDLTLVSLRGGGPRRLRTTAGALVHTDHTAYDATARWCASIYRWKGNADGLIWDSRLHPGTPSVMLFGTRVKPVQLRYDDAEIEPLWTGTGLNEVLAAAEDAGVTIAF